MAVTPYRSTTELFQPLLDDLLGSGTRWGGRMAGMDLMRAPQADVLETTDELRVMLELPGLRPEDVEVNLEDNVLTIGGEKKEDRREQDGESRWHLSERRYGRFSRSVVLPRDVEHERIEARFENGVLTVVIPKSERAKPRRITIQGGDGRHRVEAGTAR